MPLKARWQTPLTEPVEEITSFFAKWTLLVQSYAVWVEKPTGNITT